MKKIIPILLVALATTTGFLLNTQPVEAHGRYYRKHYYRRYYPFPARSCFPVTQWYLKEDPGYHPQAYSDGYRQGRESAKDGDKYKPRTAGGEFARGFDDGYYGRKFAGQRQIVANTYVPYTSSDCGWYGFY
ncbi:hypothetical protein [Iningainema tapete]|uniref:Uncharacterized protein n=1 Tax=Iningainema tapete BLCC-T55 TaxID=2748662 RepID=A0A8J6XQC8_9CYAN|nr:hypothetical protein [Iningainema tapete]MBD2775446.1 hypothetical protein [Iningainema tapete BLCC-T55]